MIVVATIEQLIVKIVATIRPHKTQETATITALAETNSFVEADGVSVDTSGASSDENEDDESDSAEASQPRAS